MKTISFIGNSEGPEKLLEIFKKMTPNFSGIWGELKGEPHYNTDYYCAIDYVPYDIKNQIDENKLIILGAHPETMGGYRNLSSVKCFKGYDIAKEFGFSEWWINYDYSYLSNLKPMKKNKTLACIMSNSTGQTYHTVRRNYLEKFCDNYIVDVYGRIEPWGSIVKNYKGACGSTSPSGKNNDHMTGKESVYENYMYALEFDATGQFYISERVLDCLLLWCKPLYWGGEGMKKLLPSKSHYYLDIEKNGDDIMDIINSTDYEESIEDISKARNILLNQLNPWAMVHKAIYGEYK